MGDGRPNKNRKPLLTAEEQRGKESHRQLSPKMNRTAEKEIELIEFGRPMGRTGGKWRLLRRRWRRIGFRRMDWLGMTGSESKERKLNRYLVYTCYVT
jgi:hypothetical protein